MRYTPKTGEQYWFVDSKGVVRSEMFEEGEMVCEQRYQFANCFQYEDQATSASIKIKQVLNSLHE